MSNHTPGPWIGIDPKTKMFRSSKGWSVDKERCSHMSAPISAKRGPVCFVVTDDWEKKAELHANARLIAAAPEMLSILLRAKDAITALAGTSVENESLVDAYLAIMKNIME